MRPPNLLLLLKTLLGMLLCLLLMTQPLHEPAICSSTNFFFWDARCVLSFLILFSEQYFHSNLGTMFLAQCLWAFNFNVETMMAARCFWAFNYIHDYILTCLYSCLCMISACFVPLVTSSTLVPCTQLNFLL